MNQKNSLVGIVRCMIAVFALMALAIQVSALEPAAPFEDGAVLQRGMKVPVWGWAKPGAKITVSFAGQNKNATAGKDGKWHAMLDPLKASAEPRELHIAQAGAEVLVIKDILVGEVWVASGQSNMQWLATKSDVGRVLQKGIKERVEAGKEKPPIIREAQVTDVFSALHPIEHATVKWGDDAGQMSAVAYAFAYDLWKALGVPIGILNCSFSSTAIEAWTPREGFMAGKDDYTKSVYQRILQTDPTTPEHKQAWTKYYADIEAAIAENDKRIAAGQDALPIAIKPPGNLQGNRDASWLYNARMHPVVPYGIRGAIWNQGYANIGGGFNYYANLHSMIRGWRMAWDRPDLPVYFHQFYSPGNAPDDNHPKVGQAADMRFGTWLARDIPNTGMASQIDIGGSIHYGNKTLPGQRLALHALKNQYGKDIVAEGPHFESYEIKGKKVIVTFDNAEGGLVVGETATNMKNNLAIPTRVAEGAKAVTLFYIADKERVWHQASVKIEGSKVVLTAPGVSEPRGVTYGSGGVGFQPNLYNQAMLPLTPFTLYDKKFVTTSSWPNEPIKVAGYTPDASSAGLLYEYRKMPLLSTQFRDNAVLQHGKPVKVWGSAIHNWGLAHHTQFVEGKDAVIQFQFGDFRQTLPIKLGAKEWSVTLPPMEPTDKPRTLSAKFYIDGELVHERVANNVVVGDVWFVAAPAVNLNLPAVEKSQGIVRVMQRKAKRDRFARPSRYSIAVSTTPKNRFASEWLDVGNKGLAGTIAHRIASRVDHPVGVIFMQNAGKKEGGITPIKSWLPFHALADAPSLAEDYEKLGAGYPGSPSYNANLRRYVSDWKTYWGQYIPEMIDARRVPDGSAWGVYPSQAGKDSQSEATQSYNVMVHSFTPATVKRIVFVGQASPDEKKGHATEQAAVLIKSWTERFGGTPELKIYVNQPAQLDAEEIAKLFE